jgi:tRNA-2-methylthio-N6-dimethylallyladenosine synthase
MIGSIQKVLVEGNSKKGHTLSGRTENMRTTHFNGNESLIGQIVSVKITGGFANSLKGELV